MATILISILMLALGGYMVFSQLQKDRRCSQPATLEIRYNPQKPEETVVQGKSFRSGVLGGGLVMLLGILALYFSIK